MSSMMAHCLRFVIKIILSLQTQISACAVGHTIREKISLKMPETMTMKTKILLKYHFHMSKGSIFYRDFCFFFHIFSGQGHNLLFFLLNIHGRMEYTNMVAMQGDLSKSLLDSDSGIHIRYVLYCNTEVHIYIYIYMYVYIHTYTQLKI